MYLRRYSVARILQNQHYLEERAFTRSAGADHRDVFAIAQLKSQSNVKSGSIGVTGFCMGGALAQLAVAA